MTSALLNSDGVVSEGAAVRAGGGADHVRTGTAQPGQDEGNQEDLQVCLTHTPTQRDPLMVSLCRFLLQLTILALL